MFRVIKRNKKILLILLAVIVVLVGVFAVLEKTGKIDFFKDNSPKKEGYVNLDPPTDNDRERAEDNKDAIVKRNQSAEESSSTSGSTATTKKNVSPTITYAGQYGSDVEIAGYVNNVYEDGGTCTATFRNGSSVVERSVSAIKNVNNVNCPSITISSNDFQIKGGWNVVLRYSSSTAQGSSDSKPVEIK